MNANPHFNPNEFMNLIKQGSNETIMDYSKRLALRRDNQNAMREHIPEIVNLLRATHDLDRQAVFISVLGKLAFLNKANQDALLHVEAVPLLAYYLEGGGQSSRRIVVRALSSMLEYAASEAGEEKLTNERTAEAIKETGCVSIIYHFYREEMTNCNVALSRFEYALNEAAKLLEACEEPIPEIDRRSAAMAFGRQEAGADDKARPASRCFIM
ncbi:MAG: hypothetical protein K0S29_936 [Gammaproteobacteria bacterium]|nr:hypothetical protein [Gammaproteobacteria bacterium]